MKYLSIAWFIVAVLASSVPIPLIKYYTETDNVNYIIGATLSYLLLIYALTIVLKDGDITILYPLLKIIAILCVVFSGVVLFKNTVDAKAMVGILLAALSIYLLTNKD